MTAYQIVLLILLIFLIVAVAGGRSILAAAPHADARIFMALIVVILAVLIFRGVY